MTLHVARYARQVAELTWYYSGERERELGLRSSFAALVRAALGVQSHGTDHDAVPVEVRLACERATRIEAALGRLEACHVRVLRAAYSPCRASLSPDVRATLGALAGAVASTARGRGLTHVELLALVARARVGRREARSTLTSLVATAERELTGALEEYRQASPRPRDAPSGALSGSGRI